MKPIEVKVLTTSTTEHLRRKALTDFLSDKDDHPGRKLDQVKYRCLYESWLVARDAQRVAQTVYADSLSPTAKVGAS